jgi:endonuclease-3
MHHRNPDKESGVKKKHRAQKIESLLRKEYPSPTIALEYSTPLQLLIAVILSAQCTDLRVNVVTPALFGKYRTAQEFANADLKELEHVIHSTGFFRNKAKNIVACCKALVEGYRGEVPTSMDELIQLPGVGRKTANCVLGAAFGIPSGIVVDTHVIRLATRLGFTGNTQPEKIETDLSELIAKKDWIHFGNALIHHGRRICDARNPQCAMCVLERLCPSVGAPPK